jgi:N-methylhydantoinase A
MSRVQLAFDIGGTFTDFVAVDQDTNKVITHKSLTTPSSPATGGLNGVGDLLAANGSPSLSAIMHATTLVTNAVIERKGSKIGLITTEGFRDVLEMRREQRYDVYDLFIELPAPLVPRYLRTEVAERIRASGQVLTPLCEDQVRQAARFLVEEQGVHAIAVVFLHAFRNDSHEIRTREIIRELYPNTYVSISSEVSPEIREYERSSTTVANAYVQGPVEEYLKQLTEGFRGFDYDQDFYIMLSAGGLTNQDTAKRFPVRMMESGPAAGVLAAIYFGAQVGQTNLLSFDLGGTTAKFAIVRDGQPNIVSEFEVARVHRFKNGSGLPLKVPVIDMIEIGAGGGSIARLNELGLLQVGPESAGADPGPACYGQGGTEPTVTDADLLLGYLNPDFFLGGKMRLDAEQSERAFGTHLAEKLGLGAVEAAWGVYEVVNENMAAAARTHMAERGCNPELFAMIAFGGAGPVHAYKLAEALYVRTVILPYGAGVGSAIGLLAAPMSFDLVHSYVTRLDGVDWAELGRIYESMEEQARAILATVQLSGDEIQIELSADVRHAGQFFEFSLPFSHDLLTTKNTDAFAAAFFEKYELLYGHSNRQVPIEIVNWRLRAVGPARTLQLVPSADGERSLETAYKGTRPVWFAETNGFAEVPVYNRLALPPDSVIVGPAILEETESTVVVGPKWDVTVHPTFALVMNRAR